MLDSVLDPDDISTLEYIITHVFCPLQLPDGDDHSLSSDRSLTGAIAAVARLCATHATDSDMPQWRRIWRTLDNLMAIVQFRSLDRTQTISQLGSMLVGDVLAFPIRAQNVAVVFRKQEKATIFESFEMSPKAENVMTTQGKLICSYPGPAIEVPNVTFDDENFRSELVNFLVHMNDDILPDAAATTLKAQSTVLETRDTAHPRYITELLTGILRSVGSPADVVRITKRIGDDVLWNNSKLPWRRSPLWLLIRVVLQMTFARSSRGRVAYKEFMLFFMCCLGKEKMCEDLPNDLLQFMSAKISRRLRKLGTSAPDRLSQIVLETCISLRSTVEKRWERIQIAQHISPRWLPSELDLDRDIRLSMLSSRDFLHSRLANQIANRVDARFSPKHRARGSLNGFLSSDGKLFEDVYQTEPHTALYDVERAVEQEIDDWVDGVTKNNDACVQLEVLADKYSWKALETYGNNPELLSVMLLTVIELWVALDKIAVKEIPMLTEYSPEVPISFLEELLLCKSASLDRLRQVHQYLSRRHSRSRGWSVFSPKITTESFAVRYYRGSSHLQHLKTEIEEAAQQDFEKKVAKLEKANARHADLKKQCINTDHDSAVTQDGREFHPKKCTKCRLEKQLKRMDITVYEWPLPVGIMAEVVLFELDCPVSFNMWRNATFHLLVDLCSPPPLKPKDPYIKLDQYTALQPYHVQHPLSRISLGSDTKPFVVTHYSRVPIPTTEKRVRVNNGLKFSAFDSKARISVSEALGRLNARKYCTHQLQGGPYQNLQKYVDATSHTSNEILANQADCHKDLSIHEFTAFGHLRSGGSLQWLNILRELRARSLTFRRQEVHLLIVQAVSQVGPVSNVGWTWHREIQEVSFCEALIKELEGLLNDVKANWLEGVTMETISFLLGRFLVSHPNQAVSQKALRLLRVVRERVFSWVTDLSKRIAQTCEDEELRGLLRDNAAVCRGTFNVNSAMTREALHSAEDVEILLSCAMLVHNNTPGKVSGLPPHSRLLLDRDRRLSLTLESALHDVIQTLSGYRGLDRAVRRVWPLYREGSKWSPFPHPNSRWFWCTTAPTECQSSQVVHFNLLDGSLLVDGKPLGRLSHAIMQHPLYNQIFGKQVLDIVPADFPGMDYSTRNEISGHQVYFSLRDDDLVIRAKQADTVLELVPPGKLEGDIPAMLISGHAHWLNTSTRALEIRPQDKVWEGSPDNWTIDCTPGQYRMHKGRELLIDIRSQSWAMISSLLEPLDTLENLLITSSPVDPGQPLSRSQLTVELPRYGLSFYVNEDGDLQSHNIRNMVYDEDQSTGTMFGLVNQLVLRPRSIGAGADELVPRCVLIPEGAISFQMDGHHVYVKIDTQGPARITYQTYRIDTELGCLTGNVSLTNKLYCAYLHALTSGCSTDSLTGKLGTEEALSLLRSGSCWSIMKFSPRDAEILGLIGSLCPSRTWYPEHLKNMQKVEWLNLPAISQHHELYVVANGIKEHWERLQLFQENQPSPLFKSFPSRDGHLLKRGALRAAHLFPSELSEPLPRASFDVRYSGRDTVDPASGEHRAYTAAATVHHRATSAAAAKYVQAMIKTWGAGTALGAVPLSLQYDRSWLNPDLRSIWLEAYNLLRKSDEEKWMQLFFSLPAMAYASPALSDIVPAFVAFAVEWHFLLEDPPNYDSYHLLDGDYPSPTTLRDHVSGCASSFEKSPESTEPAKSGESSSGLRQRQFKMYQNRRDSNADATVQQLLLAWPCETPPQCQLNPKLYDVASLTSKIQSYFLSCYRNLKLRQHLTRVHNLLKGVPSRAIPAVDVRYTFHPSQDPPSPIAWLPEVDELLARPVPLLRLNNKLPRYTAVGRNTSSLHTTSLRQLISVAEADATNQFQLRYAWALRTSAENLENEIVSVAPGSTKKPTTERLKIHYAQCKARYTQALDYVRLSLGPRDISERALRVSGQWPRITAHALFRIFASNSPVLLSDEWKKCLATLALLALELQRSRRLLRLHLDGLAEEFFRESENEGCDGWIAEKHPDWLLIQLQGNFLIRRVQVEVANEMICPSSGKNTAMQLNMGEGKSSVIVPISVAFLADGDQLVRVIVPKALTSQMFHLLVDRLGGLTNRRIYFLPFSRSVEINPQRIAALRGVVEECMYNHGILVVQPEHVLSLKLIAVEKQLSQAGDSGVPALLLDLQRWLHSRSRDILDESDEILHVRYELVYTIGLQRHMEGFPDRWTTTQQVLGLVNKHAVSLRDLFPFGVEYEHGLHGSFPHLRILHADAGQKLISWIVEDIMAGGLSNFSFGQLPLSLRNAIQNFISHSHVSASRVRKLKEHCKDTSLWGGLLLLRGLLATDILLFSFKERRWRVDYGLAPTRTMLAVPYRAKDVPAPRAEFGHPDIAIILTCLSYYYGGLDEDRLKQSFETLLKQDDPFVDYDLWIRECSSVPESLRTLSGINLKSTEQWQQSLLPLFSRNKATIDFYLSRVVFPREAKEFPSKLSCSGWDLAERRDRLLTGFSGTNDGQYLLPLDITQHDPRHQRGTNAKVLAYLLQPENNHYMCAAYQDGARRTARQFLEILAAQKPAINVLLDVGAQMLDLQNSELAKAWLDIRPDVSAAIYFNEDDELTVLTRDGGTPLLLLSSPFAQQLDKCVIYLDDAHTRGTDINFPIGFRAAVTLGPGVTKDRLAQGCMRMRKLGHGHSIMFFAPLEVDRRIRYVSGKGPSSDISAMDILQWAIRETCDDVQRRAPHWAQQGMNHASRYDVWTSFSQGKLSSGELSAKWLQQEAKTLEELYGPHKSSIPDFLFSPAIRQRWTELGVTKSIRAVSMDEEQEREVIHEAERERQVERPPRVPPAIHTVHPDVVMFVQTGIIRANSKAFRPAFTSLDATSAASNEAHVWSRSLLVTTDFERTVNSSGRVDDYLRPVQWIVYRQRAYEEVLVILSPCEAEYLLPHIRSSDHVHLHMYTPRVNRHMKPCDNLGLYSIPAVRVGWTAPSPLVDQLNAFSGQLYLKDHKTYIRLCRFLCVYAKDLDGEDGIEVGGDGFIAPKNRPKQLQQQISAQTTFQTSPLDSLKALTGLRRKGLLFTQTHVGRLLDGLPLSESDFEDGS